ncbi:FAD binding domain-containing protein [Xylaria bambusicola]|uniref:FAD binding domain-containing protein n=1 Tax=Xylaria bambusicola TaxID=326684 RepID=UPI0020075EF8|nr:FAD binding domain-containing protein [Xylaria bambusicola]KAI0503078.1 FAD binding domain-containing protein [Xylaria bambusicola]
MVSWTLVRISLGLALLAKGWTQTIVVNNQVILADASSVAPAFAFFNASSSNATADLFPGETKQLTHDVLANLTKLSLTNSVLFRFPDPKAPIRTPEDCKNFPGDSAMFPGTVTTTVFNLLLGGSLIHTRPFASPCFPDFQNQNSTTCAEITSNWFNNSYIHTDDPTSINAILFQGTTCVPSVVNPWATHCSLGSYPTLSVNVSTVAQVQLAINLARNLNIRLVIKNTGHDFSAKSTGAGSLSLWTHNLKDIRFYDSYQEGSYKGPAFKMGSGVQVFEAYRAAREKNVTIVGGEGRTVGITGGYILGGGHSPLSSIYGMGSDQVLSMEVVTADGQFLTASETSNPELFWALRGGGGSTFGVVTSMVIKAFPKIPVTTLTFVLSTGTDVLVDQFWQTLRAYFQDFIKYTDAGMYSYFSLNALSGNYVWTMQPWFGPNLTKTQFEEITAPFWNATRIIGVDLKPVYKEYDDFYEAWDESFPLESWGTNLQRPGSRLFPRENWENQTKLSETFEAIRYVVDSGGYVLGFNVAPNPKGGYPDSAVNPAWRKAVLHAVDAVTWTQDMYPEQIQFWSSILTYDWSPLWRYVSPGSGAYLSESDYIEPDFQHSFWGDKYERLYQLKKKLDPWDVFYAQNAVGSEDFQMSENVFGILPSQNSRLCRRKPGPVKQ